jgi:hypothetical protein
MHDVEGLSSVSLSCLQSLALCNVDSMTSRAVLSFDFDHMPRLTSLALDGFDIRLRPKSNFNIQELRLERCDLLEGETPDFGCLALHKLWLHEVRWLWNEHSYLHALTVAQLPQTLECIEFRAVWLMNLPHPWPHANLRHLRMVNVGLGSKPLTLCMPQLRVLTVCGSNINIRQTVEISFLPKLTRVEVCADGSDGSESTFL